MLSESDAVNLRILPDHSVVELAQTSADVTRVNLFVGGWVDDHRMCGDNVFPS